ncbi:MAG: DegQ family serine endoprotease [Gammaproteobacteria bacterium]|nr:DegQ family serine endoprotease [Gammaproteobacteria bacterium]
MNRTKRSLPYVVGLAFLLIGLVPLQGFATATAGLPDFTELVEKVGPAVVNISTTQKIKRKKLPALPQGRDLPDMPEDSPFGDLFRHFFGDPDGGGGPNEFNTQSLGSGFIVDTSGYILTNQHVVKDATEIVVRLNDRRELKAKVIGSDARSDIALLKIDATNLPVLKLGNSEKEKVGEWVMAIGSPFGFDHSVSVGVISAMGRSLPSENYVPFIQTDVAINPGNSGGPLFNLQGEVIGINSQIYTRSGGFMGLSFAIPINVAMDVVKQIKEKGKVTRGWLGILIQDVNRELAESFGMDKPMGAAVLRVLENSPAEKAGFKVGDVVVEFDGKTIHTSSDLPLAVGSTPIGKKVKVKIIRDGKPTSLTVKIAELPAEDQLAERGGGGDNDSEEKPAEVNRLGLSVEELSADIRTREEIKQGGVVVTKVSDGPASDAGIHRGDIILKLNNQDVKGVANFREIVEALPKGKSVAVLIQRHRSPMYIPLKTSD